MRESALQIPNEAHWPAGHLEAMCTVLSRGRAPTYVARSEVFAIGQRCVTGAGFDPAPARPHSERALTNALVPEAGDVLLNSTGTGTIGRSCTFFAPGRFVVDGHVTVLRIRPDCGDGRWLNAVLRTPWGQAHLETQCYSGSTNQVELSRAQLAQTRLPVPPLPEQRKIAEILDTLDEAIRKTEELTAKLKQVKQGLLHDLLTRGIDDNGELRDPDRHPEQFKDSPLGRIPRLWSVGRLENWLQGRPKNGYSPQAVEERTGIVMLGLGCLTPDGFAPTQLKNGPAGDPRLRKALLRADDLLVSRANTRELVGLAGRFKPVGTPCTYPDLMMRLTPAPNASSPFLELLLRSPPARRQIQAMASGTSGSMVKITGSIACALEVAIPDEREQRRIVQCAEHVEHRIGLEARNAHVLRDLKQGLMEDLLTGRVRVTPLLTEQDRAEAP